MKLTLSKTEYPVWYFAKERMLVTNFSMLHLFMGLSIAPTKLGTYCTLGKDFHLPAANASPEFDVKMPDLLWKYKADVSSIAQYGAEVLPWVYVGPDGDEVGLIRNGGGAVVGYDYQKYGGLLRGRSLHCNGPTDPIYIESVGLIMPMLLPESWKETLPR